MALRNIDCRMDALKISMQPSVIHSRDIGRPRKRRDLKPEREVLVRPEEKMVFQNAALHVTTT